METTKVFLDVPNDIHLKIRQIQLDRQSSNGKMNLKDIYFEVLRNGLTQPEKPKAK